MIEDEAKTKWCPMTIWENGTTNLPDRGSDKCIADKCMLWIENKKDDGFCGLGRKP